MTTSNDQILLEQILAQRKSDVAVDMPDDRFFEYFVSSETLKDRDLSPDEIENGMIGGGADGGLDGIYTFVNGELISEPTELPKVQKDISIELVIVQAKRETGFKEDAVVKLKESASDLFDLAKSTDTLSTRYRAELLDAIDTFRAVHRAFVAKYPTLKFRYVYATKSIDAPHPNVVDWRRRFQSRPDFAVWREPGCHFSGLKIGHWTCA